MSENTLIDDDFVASVRRDMLRFAQLQLRDAAQVERGEVSASLMYATARFNAWVTACGFHGAEEMQATRQQTIDYFVEQYRAMLVEIDGIRADYYPRVALYVTNEPGGFGPGDDAVCKYEFTGIVTATDDIRSGQLKIHYQPAGT